MRVDIQIWGWLTLTMLSFPNQWHPSIRLHPEFQRFCPSSTRTSPRYFIFDVMSIFVKVSWQWILFDLLSSFNSSSFDVCWDIKMLGKQYKNSFMTFTLVSNCWYQYLALIFVCVCVSFLLCSPSAPFLPEYVNSFWIQLKTWCSFILRTVLGINFLTEPEFSQVFKWLQL